MNSYKELTDDYQNKTKPSRSCTYVRVYLQHAHYQTPAHMRHKLTHRHDRNEAHDSVVLLKAQKRATSIIVL